ncbi:MAG: DNA-binding protein WhiA [Defluviitaleaceae bacterium]|nr:DNA-binding protein WhiA [Defluviitaleaceae bacterium]
MGASRETGPDIEISKIEKEWARKRAETLLGGLEGVLETPDGFLRGTIGKNFFADGNETCETESKRDLYGGYIHKQCCKRAFIRGCFIACGVLCDPSKTYHLEFLIPVKNGLGLSQTLTGALVSFGLHPKTLTRKSHAVIYIKESENIVDALNIMEAHKSLMTLENVRIVKDMRNSVNRRVNFETANLGKTVSAAMEQINYIRLIFDRAGIGSLPAPLAETAALRLQFPEATLIEIGSMLKRPIGKSGMNHRMRKLIDIAKSLESGKE